MRCRAHCNSHGSSGRCCQSTATVTAGIGTSSVCTDTFVMLWSLIAEVQVVCSMSKAQTQRKPADREQSEFMVHGESLMIVMRCQ